MTPRSEAIAFQIWRVAEPLGWDITARDIAERIGVKSQTVTLIALKKGWGTRLRKTHLDTDGGTGAHFAGFANTGFDDDDWHS